MIKHYSFTTLATALMAPYFVIVIHAQEAKPLPSAADQIDGLPSLPDFTEQLQQTIDQSGVLRHRCGNRLKISGALSGLWRQIGGQVGPELEDVSVSNKKVSPQSILLELNSV